MKAAISNLKGILQEYKEDLQYLLFAGAPIGIIEIVLHQYIDFSILY